MNADYILKSNSIFTAASDDLFDGFVAIKENKIISVDTNNKMEKWVGENTRILKYDDKLIMPGFCDSHVHLFLGSLMLNSYDVMNSKSEEEAAKNLWQHSKNKKGWIIGFGWSYYEWEKKELPTKNTLDKYFPDNPVLVFNEEMHSIWVNSKALEICDVTKDTPDIEDGEITRDVHGNPTGHLLEPPGIKLVLNKALDFDKEEELGLINNFLKKASELGVTSISDVQIFDIVKMEAYKELEKKKALTSRIHIVPSLREELDDLIRYKKEFTSDSLRFSGVKDFVDGTPMAHTGLLLEPYLDKPNSTGEALIDVQWLQDKVIQLEKHGIRVRLHACGDGAVRLALDIFEKAKEINKCVNLRHTIEHVEHIHPSDLPRFREIQVIASVQPEHLGAQEFENHPFHTVLGEERNKYAYPFESLLSNGATLAFGTDCPIVELNPMATIYRAVTRLMDDRKPENGWQPQEKLSIVEALKAYTIGSAYQMFREKDLGTLEVGKLADIVVLDQNLFNIHADKILDTKPILTMMDGNIVYEK